VFEPFYDAYVPDIQMAGGSARVVTLRPPRWNFDPDELRAAFGPRTRLIVLNTPHNPTGKVFSAAELDLVAALCCEHDVIAISDEVYSEIVFPGARHLPIATRSGMWDRTVTVDSIGKTFSVTGWKIGWAIAAPALTAAIRGVHQFVTFANATPFQEAAADAMTEAAASGYYDRLRADYGARRALLTEILHGAGLQTLPVDGAYFLLADIAALPFADDTAFCRHLISDVGVAAIPPSAFYADPRTAPRLARFCFAKRDETMRAAAERLAAMKGS
jgi:aspartate/methionine/tyrosine aminotransferase